ncbi:Prefoldin alpha subunit [Catenaria anguillulae PL171]|uniref:Prefoldin alpha subunit n=1 Tax=Catenaria anguillulae PL171 TaxID=765915 RepID=A0A1Y2I2M8_9FUNG|nr:Prefoldin alpha subunit [Catenaria anguillulae PL171]
MSSQDRQVINLDNIPLQQLQAIQEQLSNEIQALTNSFTQLKQAQAKFTDCRASLDSIKPNNQGKSMLIPLTNSLYVQGRLSNPDRVIVDVGTGYYVEKKVADAKEFYQRKTDYIKENLEKLQATIVSKQDSLRTISQVAQSKAMAMRQQQLKEAATGSSTAAEASA